MVCWHPNDRLGGGLSCSTWSYVVRGYCGLGQLAGSWAGFVAVVLVILAGS